jgi:hypothetical protein
MFFQKRVEGCVELCGLFHHQEMAYPFPQPKRACGSGQLDRLERADDVVRTFVLKKAFVEAGAEIPMVALVILIAIKSPDTADDDKTTDPIVPKIAEEMKTEVCPGKRSLKADVIIDDYLGQSSVLYGMQGAGVARARVITQRTALPFCVNDTAIVWR